MLICLPLSLCGAENLKIGLLAPPQEPDVLSLQQGAQLAIEHANQLPGPKGELIMRGRPGQWGTDGDEAAALALDESVSAIIAPPNGAASHQVMQVAGRTRIPVVSLCPDSSLTGTGIPWVLRITPRTDLEAQTIFAHVTNRALAKSMRWAALVPDGRAGREAAKDLQTAADNAGCTLQNPVPLPPHPPNWPSELKKLLATHPDAILLWVDPASAGQLAQQLRASAYKGLLAGPSRLNSAVFLNKAGQAAEAFLIPAIVPGKENETQHSAFEENYRRQFGSAPDFTATMAYDSAWLLMQVLRQSAGQPAYRAFPLKTPFPGASGPVIFDKDGNRQLHLELQVCRNGKFEPQK